MRLLVAFVLALVAPITLSAAGVDVTMAKRGNVRFGPSTSAPIVTTLTPGTTVRLLRPAEGQPGWYEIQFPRQGVAWMHAKVLTATDDPRIMRVTVDNARVRADARQLGELVAQLALNETVEWIGSEMNGKWTGRKVGDWYAVYPSGAVAYCYQSVLQLNTDTFKRIEHDQVAGSQAEQAWQQAKQTYAAYRKVLQADQAQGLNQDWAGLDSQLQRVIDEHPTVRTRLLANKLQNGIRKVLAAGSKVLPNGRRPATLLPEAPIQPVRPPTPAVPPVAQPPVAQPPVAQPPVAQQPPVQQPPVAQPPVAHQPPAKPAPTQPPPVSQPPVVAGAVPYEGWLFQKDIPGVDAQHVLVGADSQVSALIKLPAGSAITLSEFFWRRVAVRGSAEKVKITVDGISLTVPKIMVDDIHLLRR